MPATTVSLTIAEADAARTKTALMYFTGLPSTATPKELAATALKKLVRDMETSKELETASAKVFVEPNIT